MSVGASANIGVMNIRNLKKTITIIAFKITEGGMPDSIYDLNAPAYQDEKFRNLGWRKSTAIALDGGETENILGEPTPGEIDQSEIRGKLQIVTELMEPGESNWDLEMISMSANPLYYDSDIVPYRHKRDTPALRGILQILVLPRDGIGVSLASIDNCVCYQINNCTVSSAGYARTGKPLLEKEQNMVPLTFTALDDPDDDMTNFLMRIMDECDGSLETDNERYCTGGAEGLFTDIEAI